MLMLLREMGGETSSIKNCATLGYINSSAGAGKLV